MFPFQSGNQLVKTDIEVISSSPCVMIDMLTSQRYLINMVSDITYLSVVNPYEGAEVNLCFVQDTTGGRVINSWIFTNEFGVTSGLDSTVVKYRNDEPPILSLSASKYDYVKIIYNNKKFCVSIVPNF